MFSNFIFKVATRFAGDEGIILEFSNDIKNGYLNGDLLRIFECKWISTYNGEDECLFMGGRYQIRLSTLKIIKRADKDDKYNRFCSALYFFDCMVTGSTMNNMVPSRHKVLISTLIEYKLHRVRGELMGKWDRQYIENVFDAFCEHKRQIVLNLYQLNTYFHALKDLVIYTRKNGQIVYGKNNIFRGYLFELFRHIKRVIIYTTKHNGLPKYNQTFDLCQLFLSIPLDIYKLEVIIKATRYRWKQEEPTWLFKKYNEIKQELNKFPLEMRMLQTKDHEGLIEDCLKIHS